jgi:hypothetical protein
MEQVKAFIYQFKRLSFLSFIDGCCRSLIKLVSSRLLDTEELNHLIVVGVDLVRLPKACISFVNPVD